MQVEVSSEPVLRPQVPGTEVVRAAGSGLSQALASAQGVVHRFPGPVGKPEAQTSTAELLARLAATAASWSGVGLHADGTSSRAVRFVVDCAPPLVGPPQQLTICSAAPLGEPLSVWPLLRTGSPRPWIGHMTTLVVVQPKSSLASTPPQQNARAGLGPNIYFWTPASFP